MISFRFSGKRLIDMLKRKAYDDLLDWKRSADHGALLVTGARQIGKTYLVDEFARVEYDLRIKIDFIEDGDARARYSSVESADQLIDLLSLELGREPVPGKTLVFFDEVQQAPEIVTLSKYLIRDGRFDVVMSGSMLGTELKGVKSLPVGYLRIEDMFPLTFEEFCWAQGVPDSVSSQVKECFEKRRPVDEGIHDLLIKLFRRYLIVGGMPAAVQRSVSGSRDLGAVREVQSDLVRLYREDISKYAGRRSLQVKAIFDEISSQLSKENKRFQINALASKGKYDRFANDFAWLVSAGAALKVDNVTDPKPMLARTAERNRFKLYSFDMGMLVARYPAEVAMAALLGEKSVNFGAVYENYVAQELAAAGVGLYYYHHSKRGEVDFLMEKAEGGVLPIEVKSGKDYKLHTALNNLLGTEEFRIPEAVVLSEANVSVQKKMGKRIVNLPLYMVGLVAAQGSSDTASRDLLRNVVLDPIEWPE